MRKRAQSGAAPVHVPSWGFVVPPWGVVGVRASFLTRGTGEEDL
jgi:hypothetical protein